MSDSPTLPPRHLATSPQGIQVAVAGLAAGDELIRRRLFDLGFRRGVTVTPVRTAPLGDPRIYRLHGADLSLRRTEAAMVLVHPAPDGPPAAEADA